MFVVYDAFDMPCGFFDTEARACDFAEYLATVGELPAVTNEPQKFVVDVDQGGKVVDRVDARDALAHFEGVLPEIELATELLKGVLKEAEEKQK